MWRSIMLLALPAALALVDPLHGQEAEPVLLRNDSVTIRLVEVELRAAVQAMSRYLDRPVIFGALAGSRVTLETPAPVPRAEIVHLLRGILQSHGLELLEDSAHYRVRAPSQPGTPDATRAARAGAPRNGGAIELFVLRLRHARAADVAATVNALYGRGGALGELGERPPTLRDELRGHQVPPLGAEQQGGAPAVTGGRTAALAGDVTIVPDPGTNSLLIRASREDFELIEAAVAELDVRPLQVLIEVLIAEVRRDRSFSFGVDATVPPTGVRGTGAVVSATTTGIGLGDFALRIMGLSGLDIDATLRAAAARGDVTIVSRPIILAANNERATILVGSQRPFVQVSRSLPTDTPQRDQVIQYRDVGTQLDVRPTISADGYVMLQVTQEVNAATTETQFDAPVISTRSVQTQLLIRDGQTVVLGGLTDRQRDVSQGGVPVLSGIPLIGGLFGRASRRTTETELFVFLTPRVIRTDEEADEVTEPLRERSRSRRK
jgi:general secretion pathway protein D